MKLPVVNTHHRTMAAENEGFQFDEINGEEAEKTPTKNGERVSMEEKPDGPYAGMGKEDVMKYSNTPFWRGFRWTLLILLVAGWLALLGASIGLIVVSPRCLPWWQQSVVYQIYPRSFLDGKNPADGIGDFVGITEKLDYIKDLGVGAILLNSIYKSPNKDFGYDVSDLNDVNEDFGTMEEFQQLLDAAHERNLKVILDFVPNQASIESDLFKQSQAALGGENEDLLNAFTWADTIPNNWVSVYDGPAWTYDQTRRQYYLHQFSKFQPDLNLEDELVTQYLEDAIDGWFSRGVDGLNIQGTQFLYEGPIYKDEPVIDPSDPMQYDSLQHDYTSDYGGVHSLLNNWREGIFFRYSTAGTYRLLMTDSDANSTYLGTYYGSGDNPEADIAQNYNLIQIGDFYGDGGLTRGADIDELVRDWLNNIPDGKWPSFQLGNHQVRRIASRLSNTYVKAANMLLLTLPGTPICYYGDEIGMQDIKNLTRDDVKDIKGLNRDDWQQKTRDPQRGPMQWNDSANAGFTEADDPWLPMANNYQTVNVKVQLDQEFSSLEVFRELVAFRADNRAFLSTKIDMLEHEGQITAYIRRSSEQTEEFLVVISWSEVFGEYDLFNKNKNLPLPLEGFVRVATHGAEVGERVQLNKLGLLGGQGMIIELIK